MDKLMIYEKSFNLDDIGRYIFKIDRIKIV